MNATKCKGVKWNAANGNNVETNPVCWDTNPYDVEWREDGKNPWVVGAAAELNANAYDCRTKCAGKGGDSLRYCASDGWWDSEHTRDADFSSACAIQFYYPFVSEQWLHMGPLEVGANAACK